jgi:hypothetical protein
MIVRFLALMSVVASALFGGHHASTLAENGPPKTYVYFDQREEEDIYTYPSGAVGQGSKGLIAPWDPNGQLCLLPNNTGQFVTGYNPTTPDQTETPGRLKPYKQPPTGEAVWDRNGNWTGRNLYVSGPYFINPKTHAVTGTRAGGDDPADAAGSFHTDATYTGCAFNSQKVLFAADIGTAQGDFPPPDDGRIVEWFPPSYTTYCILLGPTAGGAGAHHVAGTGGLREPAAGAMAVDKHDNLLVPLPFANGTPPGVVAKIDNATIPRSAKACPGPSNTPRKQPTMSTFIQGLQQTPVGIARDPSCSCWAVSSVFGTPSIAWYDDSGNPVARPPVVGGGVFGTFNPLGLAFAADGTLFFVDIHLSAGTGGIGSSDGQGGLYEVTFTSGVPSVPTKVVPGLYYPVSVTTCTPAKQICPTPHH